MENEYIGHRVNIMIILAVSCFIVFSFLTYININEAVDHYEPKNYTYDEMYIPMPYHYVKTKPINWTDKMVEAIQIVEGSKMNYSVKKAQLLSVEEEILRIYDLSVTCYYEDGTVNKSCIDQVNRAQIELHLEILNMYVEHSEMRIENE